MVVGRTGVIHAPEEVVEPFAIEDVGCLAVLVVGEGTAFGCDDLDGSGVDAHHVMSQLCHGHIAVAPVEVVLARFGVMENIDINLLSTVDTLGTGIHQWLA